MTTKPWEITKMVKMYKEGETMENISHALLLCPLTVKRGLVKAGTSFRTSSQRTGNKNPCWKEDTRTHRREAAQKVLRDAGVSLYRCMRCNETGIFYLPVHHVDGNAYNNNIRNLRVYCPGCHNWARDWSKCSKGSVRVDKKSEVAAHEVS